MPKQAIFNSESKLYFITKAAFDVIALVVGDKVVAGATVEHDFEDWATIETLWADSSVTALTLLYSTLNHYGKLLPSSSISPAAQSVVRSFYRKYQGTSIVEENANPTNSQAPEIKAGYKWSDRLRKIPVTISKPSSKEEQDNLAKSVLQGFTFAYLDSSKTGKDSPDQYLKMNQIDNLLKLLTSWNNASVYDKNKAKRWILDNKDKLSKLEPAQVVALLDLL